MNVCARAPASAGKVRLLRELFAWPAAPAKAGSRIINYNCFRISERRRRRRSPAEAEKCRFVLPPLRNGDDNFIAIYSGIFFSPLPSSPRRRRGGRGEGRQISLCRTGNSLLCSRSPGFSWLSNKGKNSFLGWKLEYIIWYFCWVSRGSDDGLPDSLVTNAD